MWGKVGGRWVVEQGVGWVGWGLGRGQRSGPGRAKGHRITSHGSNRRREPHCGRETPRELFWHGAHPTRRES